MALERHRAPRLGGHLGPTEEGAGAVWESPEGETGLNCGTVGVSDLCLVTQAGSGP